MPVGSGPSNGAALTSPCLRRPEPPSGLLKDRIEARYALAYDRGAGRCRGKWTAHRPPARPTLRSGAASAAIATAKSCCTLHECQAVFSKVPSRVVLKLPERRV